MERGNKRLKDLLEDTRRTLAEIERTGGCPREMLAEAQRWFDPAAFCTIVGLCGLGGGAQDPPACSA